MTATILNLSKAGSAMLADSRCSFDETHHGPPAIAILEGCRSRLRAA